MPGCAPGRQCVSSRSRVPTFPWRCAAAPKLAVWERQSCRRCTGENRPAVSAPGLHRARGLPAGGAHRHGALREQHAHVAPTGELRQRQLLRRRLHDALDGRKQLALAFALRRLRAAAAGSRGCGCSAVPQFTTERLSSWPHLAGYLLSALLKACMQVPLICRNILVSALFLLHVSVLL